MSSLKSIENPINLYRFSLDELINSGVSLQQLKNSGFSIEQLKDTGLSLHQFIDAGFKIELGKYPNFSIEELIDAGFKSKLKQLGFSLQQLTITPWFKKLEDFKDTGFTPKDFIEAGFPPNYLCVFFSGKELKDNGFTINQLISNKQDRDPDELIDDCFYLIKAGFSIKELIDAGLSKWLKDAGLSAKELIDNNFSLQQLKDAGFLAQELIFMDSTEYGYSLQELNDIGYPLSQLAVCFSAKVLNDFGFSLRELKDVGLSAKVLKDNGFSIIELNDAGFLLSQLKDAGFSAKELIFKKSNHYIYSIKQLKDARFSDNELYEAGKSLIQEHATPSDLYEAGYNVEEIFKFGFTYEEIREIYKAYRKNLNGIETLLSTRIEKLLNKCKRNILLKRDRNCTYAQIQSKKGGKTLNKKRSRRPK